MLLLFEGDNPAAETLRFIEEKGNAGLWSWDLRARKSEWSRGIFTLLGIEPGAAEPSYQLLDSLTHPEDRRPPGQIDHVIEQALPIERTFRIIRPDGRIRWIQSRAEVLVGADGAPLKVIGMFFDVTRHPYGYRFRRAAKNTRVEIVPGAVEFEDQRCIRLPDGSEAVAFTDALKLENQ